jgi:Tol biopolymer transport system component
LTAVAAVAIFATRRGGSQPPARTVAFQVHPPEGTFLPEAAPNAILAVAPDESAVAFSVSTTAGPAIAVRSLDGSSVVLSGTAGGDNAFWSPDGQFIAFVADGELRKVSVQGGRPVTLASGATRAGGTWSAQGGIIFPGERGLMRTTASGGAVTPVTQIEHEGDRHMYPQFLADGESFIFLELKTQGRAPSRSAGGDINVVSPAGKRVLVASRSRAVVAAGTLLFVQSGSLLAQSFDEARGVLHGEPWHVMPQVITEVAANNNGSAAFAAAGRHLLVYRLAPMLQQLVWADRTGQSIARAGSPRGDYTNPRLSPDGGEIVLEQHEPKTFAGDLWRLDQRGLLTRVTSNGDRDHNSLPMWAADGRSVVFSRGTQILRKGAANDGDEKVLVSGSRFIRLADGSTDGRYLIYDEVSSSGRRDIFYVTLPDGTEPRAYLQSAYDEGGGRLSKDAKWFAYTSNDTGRIEVYVDTFPIRTRKMRVSSEGGHSPRWRADGRELFYMSSDRVIMSVIFEPGAAISAPVARRLFPTTVGNSNGQANYDVSGDGQRFILSQSSEFDTMQALLNWSQARQ